MGAEGAHGRRGARNGDDELWHTTPPLFLVPCCAIHHFFCRGAQRNWWIAKVSGRRFFNFREERNGNAQRGWEVNAGGGGGGRIRSRRGGGASWQARGRSPVAPR